MKSIIIFLIVKSLHFIYNAKFAKTPLNHLLSYDIFYFVIQNISSEVNLICAYNCFMAAAFYYVFYLKSSNFKFNLMLFNVLIEKKKHQIYTDVFTTKVEVFIEKFIFKLLNGFQLFIFFIGNLVLKIKLTAELTQLICRLFNNISLNFDDTFSFSKKHHF